MSILAREKCYKREDYKQNSYLSLWLKQFGDTFGSAFHIEKN